jgi:hypothetical protein
MASLNESPTEVRTEAEATVAEQPEQPKKGPYDDLLCTICNLTACWKETGTAEKPPTA